MSYLSSLVLFFSFIVGLLSSPVRTAALPRSSGCGKAPGFAPGNFDSRTTGADREFSIWLPSSYDKNVKTPVILAYHGGGQKIAKMIQVDRFDDPSINPNHIVVHLQGLPLPDGSGETAWQSTPGATSDDLGFTTTVINHLESNFCIDSSRIYATGISMGGGMTNLLACDAALSKRIKAFAPVSAANYITVDNIDDCAPAKIDIPCATSRKGIPIIAFHGQADQTIPYSGGTRRGACLPQIEHWATERARIDGITADPQIRDISAEPTSYSKKYDGGLLTLINTGENGVHAWPGTEGNPVNIDASQMIIQFFNNH